MKRSMLFFCSQVEWSHILLKYWSHKDDFLVNDKDRELEKGKNSHLEEYFYIKINNTYI